MTRSLAPKFITVRNEITNWIKDGEISPGDRLPSERELAKKLNVNHQTVRRGLAELVRACPSVLSSYFVLSYSQ